MDYQSININLSKYYYVNKKPEPKVDNNKEYIKEINKEIKVEPKRPKKIHNNKTTYLEHKIIKTENNDEPHQEIIMNLEQTH